MKVKKTGFTFIELVVVIAICAILVLTLFPVFAREGARARQSSCQSNLKQLVLAGQMYARDNGGELPLFSTGEGYSYFVATMPYYENEKLLWCPSFSSNNPKTTGSYGANFNVPSIDRLENDLQQIPLLADTRYGKKWFQSSNAISCRHEDGTNIAFADGHVKWHNRDFMAERAKTEFVFAPKLKPIVTVIPQPDQPQGWVFELTDPDGKKWIGDLHRQ